MKPVWYKQPDLLEMAVRLWKEGRPATYIAAEIPWPGLTRNAVLGKLYRMGLARIPNRVPHRTRTYTIKRERRVIVQRPAGPPKPKPPVCTEGTFIYETTGCRYAIGERDGQHTFCNHEQEQGSSYCPYHAELCQPKRRMAA